MKKVVLNIFAILILGYFNFSFGQALNENLKILEPLLAEKWEGVMKSPDGTNSFDVTINYQAMWNGNIVKFSRTMKELNSSSEGYFYWDTEAKCIKMFEINNRAATGIYDVKQDDGKLVITGVLSIDNRKFDFKNTFEFTPDGKMIDRWFQNAFGPWMAGHVIEFSKKE